MKLSVPFGGSKKPFDRLRTGLTRGLAVHASKEVVARGEDLDATVSITSGKDFGILEVGLVCTEGYETVDTENRSGESWATAYESWVPVEQGAQSQTVRLSVPADGPYSYPGTVLSFQWEVVARGTRKRGLDARATCDIEVRP